MYGTWTVRSRAAYLSRNQNSLRRIQSSRFDVIMLIENLFYKVNNDITTPDYFETPTIHEKCFAKAPHYGCSLCVVKWVKPLVASSINRSEYFWWIRHNERRESKRLSFVAKALVNTRRKASLAWGVFVFDIRHKFGFHEFIYMTKEKLKEFCEIFRQVEWKSLSSCTEWIIAVRNERSLTHVDVSQSRWRNGCDLAITVFINPLMITLDLNL